MQNKPNADAHNLLMCMDRNDLRLNNFVPKIISIHTYANHFADVSHIIHTLNNKKKH